MSWQPIDFQGIVTLDNPVIDLLHQYLDEQEGQLSRAILDSAPYNSQSPLLPYSASSPIKLSEAIEVFSKRSSQVPSETSRLPDEDWRISARKINKALWKYVETLEGSITELFQQVDQIGLEQWHSRLPHVVGSIKDLLQHKIEELTWGIKRLEDLLWKNRLSSHSASKGWALPLKLQRNWTHILDKELIVNLDKSQTFLRLQYNKFLNRYGGYVKLQEDVEKTLEKFDSYPVLPSLDKDHQYLFKKLYQLLKLWDMNKSAKAVPPRELVLALRHALSIEKATSILKYYYNALKNLLFTLSRTFKVHGTTLLEESPMKEAVQLEIGNCQEEIHTLGATISHYRDFLLRADPDPYVRSRLGFSEWVVGPEPAQTKPLLELGYDVEHLSDLCTRLSNSLKKSSSHPQKTSIYDLDQEIQPLLHEMGQPLATRRMIRSKAEHVLSLLTQLDEWDSFSNETVDYVGTVLAKLLRVDWKYHTLFEFNNFHQLYSIHQGLIPSVSDRSHINRLQKFTKLLNHVQEWVTRHRTQSHFHDIELDMNDLKVYLQDFLGYVQRISQDQTLSREKIQSLKSDIAQQLLEYRYLFGNFFFHLRQNESEGQLIRRQFLFVNQYFDSIEIKLQELQNRDYEVPREAEAEEEEDS